KEIGQSTHKYHEARGALPVEPDQLIEGEPAGTRLSWRVYLLPFLGQQQLFDQFHLAEPWDSEHNRTLLDQMPAVYSIPDVKTAGHTPIVRFVGEGAFDGQRRVRYRDIKDGTSNTIFCVVLGPDQAVPWTKPEDAVFNPDDPTSAFGEMPSKLFWALLLDGTPRAVKLTVDPNDIRRLIHHTDGEKIGSF
ncbi:MAG: DUF1559 domain-containing protein, partial [Planctomycetes bacterium]|nr:DUF1559 domain-containing protein [Planctomycetota bacterium]